MERPRKMGLTSCRCNLSSSHTVPLGGEDRVSGGLEPWLRKPEPIWVFTGFLFLLLLLEMLTCGLALSPLHLLLQRLLIVSFKHWDVTHVP